MLIPHVTPSPTLLLSASAPPTGAARWKAGAATAMKSLFPHVLLLVGLLLCSRVSAGEKALIDTTRSPHARMYMPDLADVRWNGGLLGERFEVARSTMVPH
ncbi:MAG TPA: hypothetical protein PKX00_09520, partial [Opitutaceae bacterium]|nr:hypothetical protein [Opitutaceae bacterium]